MAKKALIITIGNEILSGDVHDENSHWVAKKLFSLGVELSSIFTIPDNKELIKKYILDNKNNYDFIFTLGGMGPTPDDVTKDAIAEAFNVKIEKNIQVLELINSYYKEKVTEEKYLLALFPENTIPILTSKGDWAVGMINNNIFSFPGTPWLMKDAFSTIEHLLKDEPILKTKICVNCEETIFTDIMTEMVSNYPNVDIGSYPSNEDFRRVKLVFKSRSKNDIINCRDEFMQKLAKKYPQLEIS
ncbi:MAG: competence/damage-inducible protein A [Candidatus Sericytochromatia bacterium]